MANNNITVVMATYNGAIFLREQLESILKQSVPVFEIIVSDDGSNDSTCEILNEYQNAGKLKWYKNESRLGVVGNFKKAVSYASKGNYIAFADQDDIWTSNKIEVLQSELRKLEISNSTTKPSMIYSDLYLIDQNGKLLNKSFWNEIHHDKHRHCLSTLIFGNYVTGCTILMNQQMKNLFMEMPEKNILHDNWLAMIGYSFGSIKGLNKKLVFYRQHGNNVTFHSGKDNYTKKQLRLNGLKNIFKKNDYLKEEFKLVKNFIYYYENQLTTRQKNILRYFLYTEKLPYIFKTILRKIYFII